MGAGLAAAAAVNVCPGLGRNHAARVALLVMATTALDRDTPPLYFAGWRPIAHALGLDGSDRTQRDRVTKVIGLLTEIGVARLYDAPAPGRNATYALDLSGRAPLTLVRNDRPSPVDSVPVRSNDARSLRPSSLGRNDSQRSVVTTAPYKEEETGGAMEESLLRQPSTAAPALGLWTAP